MDVNYEKKKVYLLFIVIMLSIMGLFYLPALISHNPLPNASEIKSITYNYNVPFKNIKFEGTIPAEQYENFLSLFNDARVDFMPYKWQSAGTCLIALQNGNKIDIDFYWTAYGADVNLSSAMKIDNKYYRVATDNIFSDFFKQYSK